ncbi:MAG: aldolase catalytic domain-containing protein [Phocaeicola sp.]
MKATLLLDCTLRDGGFTNDWLFGFGTLKSTISRLDKAGVDVIEIGLIDDRRAYDVNRSILPNTKSFAPILENIKLQHSKISAMIDFGTCRIENIEEKSQTSIDIIRVIFKKKDIDAALIYCNAIMEKGYKVSVQPVSVTSYTKEEFEALIAKINKIAPYSVAIVDTYGLMHNKEVLTYYKSLEDNLLEDCAIGFHSHNNFQMAYANSIALIENNSKRKLIIDASLYGMGKGAGNAATELLAQYLNENEQKEYEISQLLESIDTDILKEYAKSPWGYSLKFFIAASQDCHPDFVSTLMNKKNLSVKAINEILSQLPRENKLTFNAALLESLYHNYQTQLAINDNEAYEKLASELKGANVLIMAPGKSLETASEKINSYIAKNSPKVISINFMNRGYDVDYVFMGNPKRYSQFFHKMYTEKGKQRVICTSNITASLFPIDFLFNFKDVLFEQELIRDNPTLMLLRILSKMDIENIAIAGFDGYSAEECSNYIGDYVEFLYCDADVVKRNSLIKTELEKIEKVCNTCFITPTIYK